MIIRKAEISDAPKLAKVNVDTWRTTYKGIISDEYLQNLSYKWSEIYFLTVIKKQNRIINCFIAEEESGKIVGFAIGRLEKSENPKYKGELWSIYVDREHQRKGIGKLLVSAVVEKLLNLNINSMLVWVLKKNPSRAFYESLGGKYIGEKPIKIGQEDLIEVAYGWENLRVLLKLVGNK